VRNDLSRREFVALTLATLALLRDGTLAAPSTGRGPLRDMLFPFHPVTRAQLSPLLSPYLQANPAETDPDRLIGELFPSADRRNADELKKGVRDRHRKDFQEGRTLVLDGWILSVTEVRLWCLYWHLFP
jgi:hypothetical protein